MLSKEAKAKLKKHSADQLVKKLREGRFEEEERVEAIAILKMRNMDVSEFEGQVNDPVEVEDSTITPTEAEGSVLTGEEIMDALADLNDPKKNMALGKLVESWNLDNEINDFNSISEDKLLQMRAILDGTSEFITSNKKDKKEKKEKPVKEAKQPKEKKEKATPKPRDKKDRPAPGTKAEKIFIQLSETDDSLYKIAQDVDTYYSVVQGVLNRYDIKRPAEKAVEADKIVPEEVK